LYIAKLQLIKCDLQTVRVGAAGYSLCCVCHRGRIPYKSPGCFGRRNCVVVAKTTGSKMIP